MGLAWSVGRGNDDALPAPRVRSPGSGPQVALACFSSSAGPDRFFWRAGGLGAQGFSARVVPTTPPPILLTQYGF
jgi:hypothetical protein